MAMALKPEVRSHHTVWVRVPGRRPVPLRYAVEDEALVCIGDDGLADVAPGTHLEAAVHEIQFGPPLTTFTAVVSDLDAATLPDGLIWEVIGHRRDPEPRHHRFVALRPV